MSHPTNGRRHSEAVRFTPAELASYQTLTSSHYLGTLLGCVSLHGAPGQTLNPSSDAEMTDQELIEAVRGGDPEAARLLYDRHASRVYAVARRLTGDESLAEDCAQETWMRAFHALESYRGDARFSTWLHRIAINSALGARRQRGRREERETPLHESLPAHRREGIPLLRIRLERALRTLPERMRQVLVLHDIEGFTHQEIGELLGIDAGTSKSQLFRARARMRERLGAPGRTARDAREPALCRV
jgi:RNA polymerase sigma-70 factor (ECF subfamily)